MFTFVINVGNEVFFLFYIRIIVLWLMGVTAISIAHASQSAANFIFVASRTYIFQSYIHFLVLRPQVSSSAEGTASDVTKMGIRLSPLRLQPDSSGGFMQVFGTEAFIHIISWCWLLLRCWISASCVGDSFSGFDNLWKSSVRRSLTWTKEEDGE